MRLPCPRFSVGGLMVLVAASTLPCLMVVRSVRFGQVAAWHRQLVLLGGRRVATTAGPKAIPVMADLPTAKGWWHYEMRMKYERAAGQPWLPVAPDSPEPE